VHQLDPVWVGALLEVNMESKDLRTISGDQFRDFIVDGGDIGIGLSLFDGHVSYITESQNDLDPSGIGYSFMSLTKEEAVLLHSFLGEMLHPN
jgi:hypothetical protein